MQSPFFRKLGLDLAHYFQGTLNLCVLPYSFALGLSLYSFPAVKWSADLPAENFSFYPCRIRLSGDFRFNECLVYWPHPSTKPGFYQEPSILEVLAPRIAGVSYGTKLELSGNAKNLRFYLPGD